MRSEYNMRPEDAELLDLAKPIQEWLLKHYDPMCKIEITDGHIKVYRSEIHLLQYIDNDDEIENNSN